MVDTVFIRELRVDAIIGIYDWERRVRQTLIIDLELATDCAQAAATDAIGDTVDYKALTDHVARFVIEGKFRLLETLAEQLAADLQAQFGLPWLRLCIGKPGAVPAAGTVGISIERGRRPDGRPPQ